MIREKLNFGILDNRFLSASVGLLDPPSPFCLQEDELLKQAISSMKEHRVGCIVATNKQGAISGIFTERDILMDIVFKDAELGDRPLSEFMTPDPKALEMTSTLAYALQLMSEQGFRHIPIVDDEHYPVGILSIKDIVDHIVSSLLSDLDSVAEGT